MPITTEEIAYINASEARRENKRMLEVVDALTARVAKLERMLEILVTKTGPRR